MSEKESHIADASATVADDKSQPKHAHENGAAKPFDSSYQSALFGGAGTLEKPAWSDSTAGRAVIQGISRGVVGALAFTFAGRISRRHLTDYNPEEFNWAEAKEKPLQIIAKGFDVVFGKPISAMARTFTNTHGLSAAEALAKKEAAGINAVHFRPKAYYHSVAGKFSPNGMPMNGRSLGAEMVAVSFDFAMMSTGAASTRNFIQMVDPNIRKTWMVNDRGEKAKEGEKAHFDAGKFLKSTGVAAWRVLTKNQGEDWAVALPYVYHMRMSRNLLGKAFKKEAPGFKLTSDANLNGGAYIVNNHGQIIGDHQLPGALDLHGRFVTYNVYTLMFREAYDKIGHELKVWRDHNYALSDLVPKHVDPLHAIKDSVRYVVKSTIKANLYMNPAVIPFWLMRTPQTKWRGMAISAEAVKGEDAIASVIPFSKRVELIQHEHYNTETLEQVSKRMLVQHEQPGTFIKADIRNHNAGRNRILPGRERQKATMYIGEHEMQNPFHKMNGPYDTKQYEHMKPGISKTFSQAINPVGKFSHWLGGKATELANALPEGWLKNKIGFTEGTGRPSAEGIETFMRNYVDASLAYTPYFFAKSEFGLRVDDRPNNGSAGRMDKAIYGLIDNVCALDPKKSGASVREIWHLSTHRAKVTMREGSDNNPDKPNTVINADGRKTEATLTPPAVVAPEQPADDVSEKRWAETVTGKSLAAQFQPGNSQTRH